MNLGIVIHILSFLILFIGIFQVFPLAFAVYYEGSDISAFVYSISIALVTSLTVYSLTRRFRQYEVKIRESFAIVTFGWILAAFFACIPFLIHSYLLNYPDSGSINTFTDAYFEMMSGFTTTGSSILTDIETVPKGLLFWRSLSHWLGGMGIILLAIAILPALGVGGMQLYQAEVPGPVSEKITPRVSQTAKILWGVYLVFTVIETILLMFGGMDLFDALCHTFGTVATGGFSTKNLSVGYFDSAYVDYVIIIFMYLAGVNFSLHYRALTGKYLFYFKDKEFLFFSSVIVISTIVLIMGTFGANYNGSIKDSIRFVLFQVVSVITTTGYGVGINEGSLFHFGVWPTFCQFLIIMLMIHGGCAGSTGGGVKSVRVYLMGKFVYNQIVKILYPRHIKLVRMAKEVIPDSILLSTLGFIMIHILIASIATLIINYLQEGDLITAFSSIMATLNNIGPGLGSVGPPNNYAHFSVAGKWLLSFCMLLGRLELYSVIILLAPAIWKKI